MKLSKKSPSGTRSLQFVHKKKIKFWGIQLRAVCTTQQNKDEKTWTVSQETIRRHFAEKALTETWKKKKRKGISIDSKPDWKARSYLSQTNQNSYMTYDTITFWSLNHTLFQTSLR